MSHSITGALSEPLRTHLVHGPSGTRLDTSAPLDSGGDGSKFSPIDLLAAALGSCAATAMSLHAGKNGFTLDHVEIAVRSEVATDPRRVSKLWLECRIVTGCTDEQYARLVDAGRHCPVRLSLHPDLEVIESFERALTRPVSAPRTPGATTPSRARTLP